MRRRRRLTLIGLTASAAAATLVAASLTLPTASADVGAPYFATSNPGSDPHMIRCNHPVTGTIGYCLYTTQDMGQTHAYPGNPYPMRDTKLYYSDNGRTGWQDKGTIFTESTLNAWVPRRSDCTNNNPPADNKPASPDVAGNCGAYHLWAPAAVKTNNTYYLFVPDVSDTSNDAAPNLSTSSRIAVASATNPFGPYTYQGFVSVHGYMSDPEVYIEGTNRYIIWADGDATNCGGFKSAKLETNMRTTTPNSVATLTIDGVNVLGTCGTTGRPYMEGASLYKFNSSDMPGPYTLVFAAKPTSVPPECATTWNGEGTHNEVIAYATATTPQGPYTYKGIIMCGSSTEWTNQATITSMNTAGGAQRWVIVYHDGTNRVRRMHAECLFTGATNGSGNAIIGGVWRNTTELNNCLNDTDANYYGLRVMNAGAGKAVMVSAADAGASPLVVNRNVVGTWEGFQLVHLGAGNHVLRSRANGLYVCAASTMTPLKANCSSGATGSIFNVSSVSGSSGMQYRISSRDLNGKYVRLSSADNRLYANGTQAQAAIFTDLKL